MNNKKLKKAIDRWNNPLVQFQSSLICLFGHSRGIGFLDKFDYKFFDDKSEEEIDEFISIVNGEVDGFQNCLKQLTSNINSHLIEMMRKK